MDDNVYDYSINAEDAQKPRRRPGYGPGYGYGFAPWLWLFAPFFRYGRRY